MLTEVIAACGGRAWGEALPVTVRGVSTDSRSVGAGEVFFALRGERFDGHAYVAEVLVRGAVAAVISERELEGVRAAAASAAAAPRLPAVTSSSSAGAPAAAVASSNSAGCALEGRLVLVDDVRAALGRLAAFHRQQLPGQVIAVVGSNGKTTTKFMIDHVLSGRMRGRCAPKSFNNDVGVPLTLLSADALDEYLVVEVGTNAPGEIAQLAAIVQPDLALLTCIGEEHLERLGNLEGVAREECAILQHVAVGGLAAVNGDPPHIAPDLAATTVKLVTFGKSPSADLRVGAVRYEAGRLRFTINERFEFELSTPGLHNAYNAAGAAAIARRLGFSYEQIAERLRSFALPPMRTEILQLDGVTLMNDAYNANPHSAAAALETLQSLPARGRRIVVFGEMRELGQAGPALHRRVAEQLRAARVDHVLLLGQAGEWMSDTLTHGSLFGPAVERCASLDDCAQRLCRIVRSGDVVLLKASRAVGLEQLVAPLQRHCSAAAQA